MEIEKQYEPAKFEPRWAKWWVESNMYHADSSAPPPRFSIVIPPPSVNGSLHIGHMLEHSIIDATVRWHRMRGDNTLWLPGTDHAGIATHTSGIKSIVFITDAPPPSCLAGAGMTPDVPLSETDRTGR